jgi:hypothetical protein
MAEIDARVVGITPAMREGSDMVEFGRRFPSRFHDVGIAEQHAVTFAAGLACEGAKPVVAIYSTFLQRAYDQLIHDVAIQNLPVVFAIDRAGLVGSDGPTHAGSFDIAFLRCIPNMSLLTPADENECRQALYTALLHDGPTAVRYPRGTGCGVAVQTQMTAIPFGKGVLRCKSLQESSSGRRLAILAFGTLLHEALKVGERLDASVATHSSSRRTMEHTIAESTAETHRPRSPAVNAGRASRRRAFEDWRRDRLAAVEVALEQSIPLDAPADLGNAMRYCVLGGGKRIRALLALAAAEAVGAAPASAIRAACAVELMHAYSLVHDDLPCMDDDVLRRGKPTAHVQFGEAQALLAGDALKSLAFEVLTSRGGILEAWTSDPQLEFPPSGCNPHACWLSAIPGNPNIRRLAPWSATCFLASLPFDCWEGASRNAT